MWALRWGVDDRDIIVSSSSRSSRCNVARVRCNIVQVWCNNIVIVNLVFMHNKISIIPNSTKRQIRQRMGIHAIGWQRVFIPTLSCNQIGLEDILKENVELRAQLELLTSNYKKLEESH
jgi:hypothetical protein